MYAVFATASTFTNILVQRLVLAVYSGSHDLLLAMFGGTIAGISLKYTLDRKYIFMYRNQGTRDGIVRFFLYTVMSVLTTLVFWSVELTFHYLWSHPWSKYIGAALGLTAGYTLKYFLDKRFVFTTTHQDQVR